VKGRGRAPHRVGNVTHRKALKAGLALSVSTLAACALLELGLRAALFGGGQPFESLRRAARYADPDGDEDCWKLEYRFGPRFPPPRHPHPVLGWVGRFSPDTYAHDDEGRLAGRRPVLLYGDSFAACAPGVRCFEEILGADPAFAEEHLLLNYGVGGYGVDQILLLLQRSIERYEDPFVVLSLMTLDLDRSVLTVRTGQKPRFGLEDGELVLDSPPIEPDAAAFFDAHPPGIRSYVYRGLLYSRLMPRGVRAWLTGERASIARKEELNGALIRELLREVRSRGLDCVFLVFHPHVEGSTLDGAPDWRERFLRALLEREQVPLIWSKDLVERSPEGAFDAGRYILPGDGHPTALFNELIAQRIRDAVAAGR
jgi:hypothetical protein